MYNVLPAVSSYCAKGLRFSQVLLLLCMSASFVVEAADADDGAQVQAAIQIQALKKEAEALIAAGRGLDAKRIYEKILIIDPGDFEAKRRAYDLALDKAELGGRYFVQQQLLAVEAQTHLKNAERYHANEDIDKALAELDKAEQLHNRSNNALSETDMHRLAELRIALFRMRKDFEAAEQVKQRLENQERIVVAVAQNELRDRSLFEQRMARITNLVQKGLYERALVLTRGLVRDYPGDPAADHMFVLVVDLAHKQRQQSYDENMENLKREIRHQMHESLIPKAFDGFPLFAEDWEIRVNAREVEYYEVELPEWQLRLQNKIAERTTVNFEDHDIGDALDFLSTRLGVNLVVDPDIRASGVQVTLMARDMAISNILDWLALQADAKWQFYNEAIYFGAPQQEEVVMRVYDVGQLIYAAPDFPGVELNLSSGLDASGGGAGLFADDFTETDGGIAPEDLIDLLQETVDPQGWEDNDEWGVRIRGTMLMISASEETHLLIQEFINGLKNANDIVVNISARWVTISDLFVEEIGVDWLNEGRIDGVVGDAIHPEQPISNSADSNFNINVEHVLPDSAVSTANSIISRGLRLDFAILDAIQAVAVFEAVQFKEKARILEEISVSVHNGARANAFTGTTVAYIRDYDVETTTNGGGRLDPQIGLLNTGAALDIKPFVSSDRKYVTLDLRPSFSDVEFDIAELVALQTLGNIAFEQLLPIELPIVTTKQARTRVMIPDRGTLLAGGFGQHIEQNSYAQIPVLGNLPFIGRLFSKRAIRESRASLYLMVSAKIIMYSELEKMQ